MARYDPDPNDPNQTSGWVPDYPAAPSDTPNSPMGQPPPQTGPAAPTHGGKTKPPSIEDILGNDPFYQQLSALLKAMGIDEKNYADYKIGRIKSLYGSANDPISLLGRAKQAYDDRARYIINTLAGRNMIFSGETGWQQARNALDYQRSQFDLNWKMQDYVDGILYALAQADKNRQMELLQAQWDAVNRFIGDNPQTGEPTAPPYTGSSPMGGY